MKSKTAQIIYKSGLIPLFYHHDADSSISVINACYKGGVRVVEYVNRGDAALLNFPVIKDHIQNYCPGMILGAGSVLNRQQAEKFIQLGADFIVSPILSKEIALSCIDHDTYWIPGCATPTEIARARALGADIIKVFPGNVLGPGFIKSVLGPMPGLKLMPTGGVEPTKDNLRAWFDAGAVGVGMGSKLIDQEMTGKPDLLTAKVKEVIDIIISIRN
ncbi:MAG: bifunctional 4-hydroxy-2-oxoglutarate aldolase/2-dehydro-3-deoxy-phosphogluconate aldolase [Bacteroidota bacterium]